MADPILSFQPAHADDFESLAQLRIEAMRDSLERIGRFDPVRARERLRASFAPERTRHLVVDGERVGFVVVTLATDRLTLDHLYLRPAVQGRGIGAAVMGRVFEEAGTRPVHVTALRDSDSNRFYLTHGFELVEREAFDNHYVRRPAQT